MVAQAVVVVRLVVVVQLAVVGHLAVVAQAVVVVQSVVAERLVVVERLAVVAQVVVVVRSAEAVRLVVVEFVVDFAQLVAVLVVDSALVVAVSATAVAEFEYYFEVFAVFVALHSRLFYLVLLRDESNLPVRQILADLFDSFVCLLIYCSTVAEQKIVAEH